MLCYYIIITINYPTNKVYLPIKCYPLKIKLSFVKFLQQTDIGDTSFLTPKKGKVRDKILNSLVLWITVVLNKNTISFFSFLFFLFALICWYLNFIHILKKTLLNVTLV